MNEIIFILSCAVVIMTYIIYIISSQPTHQIDNNTRPTFKRNNVAYAPDTIPDTTTTTTTRTRAPRTRAPYDPNMRIFVGESICPAGYDTIDCTQFGCKCMSKNVLTDKECPAGFTYRAWSGMAWPPMPIQRECRRGVIKA